MPEILEVEAYRRAARAVVGRTVDTVAVPDPWWAREAPGIAGVLVGRTVTDVGRHGKLLLIVTGGGAPVPGDGSVEPVPPERERATAGGTGPLVGLRFGMTGRLVVDDASPVTGLIGAPPGDRPGWVRFAMTFREGGSLVVVDPRRLGGVVLEPDLSRLGPDAWTVTPSDVARALAGSRAPIKVVLMDQRRIAGLGNLLVDEILWRAGVDPRTPADRVDPVMLAGVIVATLDDLWERGGSHSGDLPRGDAPCPRCGGPLSRTRLAGRTTWWCPTCQR